MPETVDVDESTCYMCYLELCRRLKMRYAAFNSARIGMITLENPLSRFRIFLVSFQYECDERTRRPLHRDRLLIYCPSPSALFRQESVPLTKYSILHN
jgi:hypothetical protein